jgi:hypothetical protein
MDSVFESDGGAGGSGAKVVWAAAGVPSPRRSAD